MVKAFFPKEWESSTPKDLAFNRARLAGFIEGIDNKERTKFSKRYKKFKNIMVHKCWCDLQNINVWVSESVVEQTIPTTKKVTL